MFCHHWPRPLLFLLLSLFLRRDQSWCHTSLLTCLTCRAWATISDWCNNHSKKTICVASPANPVKTGIFFTLIWQWCSFVVLVNMMRRSGSGCADEGRVYQCVVHVAGCVDGERVCQLQQRPLPRPPPAASSCSRLIDPLSLHYDKQQKPLGQVCLSFSVCLSVSLFHCVTATYSL